MDEIVRMLNAPLKYIHDIRAVHHEVERVKSYDSTVNAFIAPMEVSATYSNNLGIPISVGLRSGFTVELPPLFRRGASDFTVCFRVTLGNEVKIDSYRLSSVSTPEGQILRDALEHGSIRQRRGVRVAEIEYSISEAELRSKGGSLYLRNLDLMVSLLHGGLVPHHPYSEQGIRHRLVAENEAINTVGSFGYTLEIIDNSGVYGDRYINVNNEVFKVTPRPDPDRPDGVYKSCSGPVEGAFNLTPPQSVYYTFEEVTVENTGFYKTYEEALTLGDVLSARKRELEELSMDLKREEARIKSERQEREEAFDARKQKLLDQQLETDDYRKQREARHRIAEQELAERQTRLKDEISELEHRRQISSMHQKDHYETRSYERKDSSELLKLIPTFVAGVAAAILAIKKFT